VRPEPAALSESGAPRVVLIDALNVARSRWPNVPALKLIERCRSWAREQGCGALVVFDGSAPRSAPEADPAFEIVGAGPESADDWIARRAAELAAAERPYWLVTSDRELRRRAGAAAQRQIGGGGFLEQLGLARR
jgi:predicted RNA-binding protein with PIN domain